MDRKSGERIVDIEKQKQKIEQQTQQSLQTLGIWRDEFKPTVQRYAAVYGEYLAVNEIWMATGCPITTEYTNKAGATNTATHPTYSQLQKLRAELLTVENSLGLTPAGLKKIKEAELKKQKRASRFEEGLNALIGNKKEN